MKEWRTTTAAGMCAYDSTHHWAEGARVYALTSPQWTRAKLYCAVCAVRLHAAPADPGEAEKVAPVPVVRAESWQRVGTLAAGFDAKLAQAGRDAE